jgi:arginase
MSDRVVEVIVVPYDVERDDSPAARGPRGALARGLLAGIEQTGWSTHVAEIPLRGRAAAKAEKVAELGRSVARAVANAHSQRRFPLVLAGGCLVAVGVVTGLQRTGRELRVVWIDAHGDFNTPESTPSGYWDGMALAAVCGRSLPEVYKPVELRPIHYRSVVHLAGRNFDPPETDDFKRLNLRVIPPTAVGTPETLQILAESAAADGDAASRSRQSQMSHLGHQSQHSHRDLYLHVDVDGLDPGDAPAVRFPCAGGPPLEALAACFAALRTPAAMTLSTLSFEHTDEAQAERTLASCLRLLEVFLRRPWP